MKRNIQIAFFLSLITFSLSYMGCKKMDDSYKQFIENGETIYIAKADSIKINGGRNRAEVTWLLLSDPKVSRYKILWNNGRDSVTGELQKTQDIDLVTRMVDNVQEGNYFFDIYLYDKYGNSSIKSSKLGRVYGDMYEASLLTRAYRSLTRSGNDISIEWMEGDESTELVQLEYVNTNGDTITVEIDENEIVTTIIKDIAVKGSFKYRTAFRPEANSLDLFYTPYTTIQLTF